MIEAHQLTRRYGDFTAVDGISFAVPEGEIVGMLGPNGAGKTTAIRMMTGFLPPSSGRVTVGGRDLFADPVAAKREIGYLPENVALYPEMRVEEYLAYRARLEGLERAAARRAIASALDRCLIADVRRQVIGTLSKGYRQRVGLAAAILHDPKVLVLDEPTVGLDPKQIVAIRELIRELGGRHTLLLSTHILPEVELLCRRVVIIDRGRIVAEGSPEALRERWLGTSQVRIGFAGAPPDPGAAAAALGALPGVEAVRAEGPETVHLECAAGADPRPEAFRLAVERGWTLRELAMEKASLEDLFVRLTTREEGAGEPAAGSAEEVAS
ncbi:MAG: ATP-binding cassette domain-containing protein [Thermoanaerobaculia bacterium]|nr:ATP-binding cassette domain-containing protein [Thermoanaerobaculia bacterium]